MSSNFYLTKAQQITLFNCDHSYAKFFVFALMIIGKCRYVLGGCFKKATHGFGLMRHIGILEKWIDVYNSNKKRLDCDEGIECSTYVCWVVFNTFGKFTRFVPIGMCENLISMFSSLGLGTSFNYELGMKIEPGTIMSFSRPTHIFIVLQQFENGSMLILNSLYCSDQAIGATFGYDGRHGMAYLASIELMQEYFPEHFARINRRVEFACYFNTPGIQCFTFYPRVLPDPDGLKSMDAKSAIKFLSENKIIQFKEYFEQNITDDPENPIREKSGMEIIPRETIESNTFPVKSPEEESKKKVNPFNFEQKDECTEDKYAMFKKYEARCYPLGVSEEESNTCYGRNIWRWGKV